VYEFLSPEEAMDNADSYAQLAQTIGSGRAPLPADEGRRQDELSDCPNNANDVVRPAVAWAARWNLNAVNIVGDARPAFRAGYAGLRKRHFGSDDPARIKGLLEVYEKARAEFDDDFSFECETAGGACSGSTIGYFRHFIVTKKTLHLCPSWFAQGEQARITTMYELVLAHDADVSQADRSKYSGLAKDLTDQYFAKPAPLPAAPQAGGP
jgi:hypothetical protein